MIKTFQLLFGCFAVILSVLNFEFRSADFASLLHRMSFGYEGWIGVFCYDG